LGAIRIGDSYIIHCCDDVCHPNRKVVVGSPNVFVNGKPIARKGDAISCGDKVLGTSTTVFAN